MLKNAVFLGSLLLSDFIFLFVYFFDVLVGECFVSYGVYKSKLSISSDDISYLKLLFSNFCGI